MRPFTGFVGFTAAAAGVAAAMLVSTAAPSPAANQALFLNGIGTAGLPDLVMSNVLGGMFGSHQRTDVTGPLQARPVTGTNSLTLTESVSRAVTKTDAAIASALSKIGPNERVTVIGLSAGSLVADDVMRKLLTSPNAPAKSKLTFVVIADSSRIPYNKNRLDATLGYQYRPPADTKYDTLVVAAEYDGFADFPDRPWNALAVANAIAGEIVTHVPSMFTNLSKVPAANITVTTNSLGGVTTRYFVPAAVLPLVQLIPSLKSQEAALRKIVDSGYARNDGKPAGAALAVAASSAVSTAPATAANATPVTNPAPATVAAPVAPVRSAAAEVPVTAIPAGLAGGDNSPSVTPPAGRASGGAGARHSVGHRGPGVRGSDNAQTAKPAAAARTGNSASE